MKINSDSEDYYLALCKQLVEEKLGWGNSDTWSHADFVEASEKISEEAGITLSVTTIKRIFGKVKYNGSPASSTLNGLAVYLGYENWRDFKLKQEGIKKLIPEEGKESLDRENHQRPALNRYFSKKRKRKNLFIPYLSTLILLICALYFLSGKVKEQQAILSEDIVFNSEPVTTGLPNTVVFNYDITALDFDSAFIQQNWDSRRRQKITRENKQLTSVYYYPGHFHAKLVLDEKVVKEHGLLIPTEGWLGIIDQEGFATPSYILPQQLINKKSLHATSEVLKQKKVDINKDFQMTYSNAKDFGVNGDNFILETAIKNNLDEGGLICQESFLLLDCETGIIWLPLTAPGCIGNIGLQFGDVFIDGQNTDLSAFGTDLSVWNQLKCVVKNQHVEILLNDKLIYSVEYKEPLGKIMGINFKFHGAGAVDYIRLKNKKEEVIFEDEFYGEERI